MRTDKSQLLAAERQYPMTAAEHARATGHQDEYERTVPRTCICPYQWNGAARLYERLAQTPGCPWHTRQEPARAAGPARQWCACGAGLFIMMRNPDDGSRYFECGSCETVVTGD
jgi:hypothetical protein